MPEVLERAPAQANYAAQGTPFEVAPQEEGTVDITSPEPVSIVWDSFLGPVATDEINSGQQSKQIVKPRPTRLSKEWEEAVLEWTA